MDSQGTVRRKKLKGQTRFSEAYDAKLAADPKWRSAVTLENVVPQLREMERKRAAPRNRSMDEKEALQAIGQSRRWAGLGPPPPGLRAQMPLSVQNSQDEELYEIDGIVEHKHGPGGYKYLVRYKGWEEGYDEWLPEEALETAPGAIKEYWARKTLVS